MKTLTWQKPGQQNVAQELIKIIINYVAELRNISLLALLGVILSYQIIGTAFEWALCGNFFLAVQDFRMGIPGMLIQWFGGYALLKAIAKK